MENTSGIFCLLRHGETETKDIFRGRVDDPLGEEGWRQMEHALDNLTQGNITSTNSKCANTPWDLVLSSPLSRCADFAAHFANQQGVEFIVEDDLIEYHFGDWDGKTYGEVMSVHGKEVDQFFADPFSNTPPNGESFAEFHRRVIAAWGRAIEEHRSKSVLIITHGGVIMSVLADIFGVQRIHGCIDVPYASVSRVQIGNEGYPHRLLSHG